MSVVIDELINKINQLKKELIEIVAVTGLNSFDTMCCSRKLDQLITIYQKHSYEKNRNMMLNNNKDV